MTRQEKENLLTGYYFARVIAFEAVLVCQANEREGKRRPADKRKEETAVAGAGGFLDAMYCIYSPEGDYIEPIFDDQDMNIVRLSEAAESVEREAEADARRDYRKTETEAMAFVHALGLEDDQPAAGEAMQ